MCFMLVCWFACLVVFGCVCVCVFVCCLVCFSFAWLVVCLCLFVLVCLLAGWLLACLFGFLRRNAAHACSMLLSFGSPLHPFGNWVIRCGFIRRMPLCHLFLVMLDKMLHPADTRIWFDCVRRAMLGSLSELRASSAIRLIPSL